MIPLVIFDDSEKDLTDLVQIVENTNQEKPYCKIALATDDTATVDNYLTFEDRNSLFIFDIIAENRKLGFELCEKVLKANKRNFVAFITDYPEHIENDVNYQMRSLCFIKKQSNTLDDDIKNLLETAYRLLNNSNYYIIETRQAKTYVHYDDIYFIEKINNSHQAVMVHKNGRIPFTASLSQILADLDGVVVRCHKSFLINKSNICGIVRDGKKLLFPQNTYCFYSARYKKVLDKWIL